MTVAETALWGKLSWQAIPLDQPIVMAASALVAVGITGVLAWWW